MLTTNAIFINLLFQLFWIEYCGGRISCNSEFQGTFCGLTLVDVINPQICIFSLFPSRKSTRKVFIFNLSYF